MELDEDDRRAHAPSRTGNALGVVMAPLVVFVFVGLVLVAALGGSSGDLKGLLISAGLVRRPDLSDLYRRWSVPPLAIDQEQAGETSLRTLQKEPCAPRAMLKLADAVSKSDERWAADALAGWSRQCRPDNAAELRRAAALYIDLHEYAKAAAITSDLIAAHPTISDYWYLDGKANVGLGKIDEALLSYANTIHLAPRPGSVGRWVFQEMSDIYASQKRYCEAIGPMQDYMSIDLARRATPQADQVVESLAQQGHCSQPASGAQSFPTGGSNVIRVRASIDGTSGIFVVDTGASFVTVTRAFATKAHLVAHAGAGVQAMTANGGIYARLATAGNIKAGSATARHVPVAIQDQSLGDIDGLLGRSFLSRFDLAIGAAQWTLRAKSVGIATR